MFAFRGRPTFILKEAYDHVTKFELASLLAGAGFPLDCTPQIQNSQSERKMATTCYNRFQSETTSIMAVVVDTAMTEISRFLPTVPNSYPNVSNPEREVSSCSRQCKLHYSKDYGSLAT